MRSDQGAELFWELPGPQQELAQPHVVRRQVCPLELEQVPLAPAKHPDQVGVIVDAQQPSIKRGIKEVELSWILEDNAGMRKIVESISGRVYKTYRVYSKQLT